MWSAIVQPVPGGNIPVEHPALELKLTFKDGGAFDFHSTFERIKERLQQAVDIARESGHLVGNGTETGGGRGGGALSNVNMDAVHLDELPAYEDATGAAGAVAQPTIAQARHNEAPLVEYEDVPAQEQIPSAQRSPSNGVFTPPDEPPPGYETVQNQSVASELESRLRGSTSS